MNLFQMSLSGGVLILVIILIRTLLVNRFPKRFFLFLWGICLVRLLIPFSVSSDFSVYSMGMHLWNRSGNMQEFEAESPLAGLLPVTSPQALASAGMATADSVSPLSTELLGFPAEVFGWIWLLGFLAVAVFFGICYTTCLRNYKTSLPVSTDFTEKWLREHPLRRKISIRQSDLVSSPLTYGFFKPVILLPKTVALDNTSQLRFIFLHEYVHICRFDSLAKLLMILTLCIHWFNPFVWAMYLFFNRDLELACDEAVVRFSGVNARASYARTLVSMEAQRSVPTLLFNSFSKNTIEERIIAIMKPKKITLFGGIAAVAMILCIGTCFLTSASAAETGSSDKQSSSADVVPQEEMQSQLDSLKAQLGEMASEAESQYPAADTTSDINAGTASDQVPGTDTGSETLPVVAMLWPTESTEISASYGTRVHPISLVSISHDHIDIAGTEGDDVYAALPGTIVEVGFDGEQGRGNYIILAAADGTKLIYGQLLETLVSVGDEVAAGETIAYLGQTGTATGPHLSFGVFVDDTAVDPMGFFE